MPLLVESLAQADVVLLLTCLETLADLLEFKQQLLEDHINTFLPKFLQLSRFKDSMVKFWIFIVILSVYSSHSLGMIVYVHVWFDNVPNLIKIS